jgi:alpha-galactosidase
LTHKDNNIQRRIAFIGGASMTWMPSFAHDFVACKALAGSTLVLMDIDTDHLHTMKRYVERMVEAHGGDLTIAGTTERAEALMGADYVVTTFGPGGHQYWKEDVGIALRYGIQEPAGMSVGPGGLMQGLKGIPTIVEIAQDIGKLCPKARLFNYTNPMSSLTLAFNRHSTVQGVGVCPGIYSYIERIGRTLGVPPGELHYLAGGVNHMNWVLKVLHDGQDILPQFRKRAEESGWETVSRTLYGLFDAWPVPGDSHTAEFTPYFIGKGRDIEKQYNLPHDYIERRIERRAKLWKSIEEAAWAEGEFHKGEYESREFAEVMIQAIEFNEDRLLYLNVMNNGAIANVQPGVCVEVPVMINRYGFHPAHIGELPPGAAAISNLVGAVQSLTVEAALKGDRHLALQALALDPLTYSLDLKETEKMLDEMLLASRPALPRFFN